MSKEQAGATIGDIHEALMSRIDAGGAIYQADGNCPVILSLGKDSQALNWLADTVALRHLITH